MKTPPKYRFKAFCIALMIGSLLSCQKASEEGKLYYAIASSGIVYGYVERTVTPSGDPAAPRAMESACQ